MTFRTNTFLRTLERKRSFSLTSSTRWKSVSIMELTGTNPLATYCWTHFLFTVFIMLYIYKYIVYICSILYVYVTFLSFQKYGFHISWTIFLAVIRLCILYIIGFSNKSLPVHMSPASHAPSFWESPARREAQMEGPFLFVCSLWPCSRASCPALEG